MKLSLLAIGLALFLVACSQGGAPAPSANSLSLSAGSEIALYQGESGSEVLTLSSQGSSSGTVTLGYQVSGNGAILPNSDFSFSPSSVTVASGAAVTLQVKVTTSLQVTPGTYQIAVSAQEGTAKAQTSFQVQVSSALSFSKATPLTVAQGESGSEVLTLSGQGSLSGTVTLGYQVSEDGVVLPPSSGFDFSLTNTTLAAGKAVQIPVSVKTPSDLAGHYQVKVIATLSSGVNAVVALPLTVVGEQVIHTFGSSPGDGANPRASLISGGNGDLYGTTMLGGNSNLSGTVFELSPSGNTWTETVIVSFNSGDPFLGSQPQTPLVLGSNGNLYGTTSDGGANNAGIVFQLSPAAGGVWTEALLYSFGTGSDGAFPQAPLVLGSNGNLYGTTSAGGANGNGTVFQLSAPVTAGGSWSEAVLYSFGSSSSGDGNNPDAPLTPYGGDLYGTTSAGGANGNGTVFQLSPFAGGGWTETALYSFGSSSGTEPTSLVPYNGNLYGTTSAGGANSDGTIFQISVSGNTLNEKVLYSFLGGNDGAAPYASLVPYNGNLYGTTSAGGANGDGTIFELSPPVSAGGSWSEKVLYSFLGGNDGAAPYASLVPYNGNLYGTTSAGGANGDGTAFKLVL
jgi:uncharacterized repeat protein (TIGR03803 family)